MERERARDNERKKERQREQEQTARESRQKYIDRGKDKESEKIGTRYLINVFH